MLEPKWWNTHENTFVYTRYKHMANMLPQLLLNLCTIFTACVLCMFVCVCASLFYIRNNKIILYLMIEKMWAPKTAEQKNAILNICRIKWTKNEVAILQIWKHTDRQPDRDGEWMKHSQKITISSKCMEIEVHSIWCLKWKCVIYVIWISLVSMNEPPALPPRPRSFAGRSSAHKMYEWTYRMEALCNLLSVKLVQRVFFPSEK